MNSRDNQKGVSQSIQILQTSEHVRGIPLFENICKDDNDMLIGCNGWRNSGNSQLNQPNKIPLYEIVW